MIVLKGLIVAWFITRFEPLQISMEMLPDNLFINIIRLFTGCLMCVGFWYSLYISGGDIYVASLSAFLGFWYDKILGFYENKVRLN